MDTSITLGQLLSTSIIIIGAMLLFWNNTNVRIKVLEMKVQLHDDLIKKIDELKDAIHQLDVKLTNKADRHERH
jgi:uncharacterized membrane protein